MAVTLQNVSEQPRIGLEARRPLAELYPVYEAHLPTYDATLEWSRAERRRGA